MDSIKRGFEAKYKIPFDDFMMLDLLGTPNEKHCKIVNPDKYMLYSDCFMGLFDNRVAPNQAESYAQCSQKLEKWTSHPEYGRLFLSLKALCDVMSIKFDLGVRTRNAYLIGEVKTMGVRRYVRTAVGAPVREEMKSWFGYDSAEKSAVSGSSSAFPTLMLRW